MAILNHMNTCFDISEIKVGDMLVIRRKSCRTDIIVQCKQIVNGNEIIFYKERNDYFNFDMYKSGEGWVWRVWNLGPVMITAITNNQNEFPR